MHCTDVERPKAKKPHRCMSCGEGIAVGETYVRWRCYDGGDASTNKMHPECLAMHQADAARFSESEWEYEVYGHERPKPEPLAICAKDVYNARHASFTAPKRRDERAPDSASLAVK